MRGVFTLNNSLAYPYLIFFSRLTPCHHYQSISPCRLLGLGDNRIARIRTFYPTRSDTSLPKCIIQVCGNPFCVRDENDKKHAHTSLKGVFLMSRETLKTTGYNGHALESKT